MLISLERRKPMSVKIMAVGDVCGEPGLEYLTKNLRRLRKEMEIDFVVVNGDYGRVMTAFGPYTYVT